MINKEDRYDFAHFEFIMRGLTRLMEQYPEARDYLSLSLHCEVAEILNAYTKIVELSYCAGTQHSALVCWKKVTSQLGMMRTWCF